ncbi:MAG: hypothetical protein ACUVWQ_09145 [Candidatus Aminicenantales bacterium]
MAGQEPGIERTIASQSSRISERWMNRGEELLTERWLHLNSGGGEWELV